MDTQMAEALQFAQHSRDSSLREKVVEHLFIGTLLGRMWRRGLTDLEVLKPEVDRAGYDLVLESNGVLRHLQLKASFTGATTRTVDIRVSMLEKSGGCILWIEIDPESMTLERYYWLGGEPGQKLPDLGDRIARHSRADAFGRKNERPGLRVVNKGRFRILDTMDEVIEALFGKRAG